MTIWISLVGVILATAGLTAAGVIWAMKPEFRPILPWRRKPAQPEPVNTQAPARHRAKDLGGATARIDPTLLGQRNAARAGVFPPDQDEDNA